MFYDCLPNEPVTFQHFRTHNEEASMADYKWQPVELGKRTRVS